MSRVGRQPIEVPAGVEVTIDGRNVKVKGPKGQLEHTIRPEITITQEGATLTLTPMDETKKSKAMWGLSRSLVANMVQGVAEGFSKKLEIEGVGYRAAAEGDGITLNMGYSHPVKLTAPEQVQFEVDQNTITITGPDKETVGQFAASIKKVRPVEPYKGKGIRYEGEQVRRKVGKRAAGEGAEG